MGLSILVLPIVHHRFSRGKSLLRCHQATFGPRGGKGPISQLSASGGDSCLIGTTFDRGDGSTSSFAQSLRRTPQSCRPCHFSLRCDHACQPFQAKGKGLSVPRPARHRYALLVERLGTRIVPSSSNDLCECIERDGRAMLLSHLLEERHRLLNSRVCQGRLPFSEG